MCNLCVWFCVFQRLAAHVVMRASVRREAVLRDAHLTAAILSVEVSPLNLCNVVL